MVVEKRWWLRYFYGCVGGFDGIGGFWWWVEVVVMMGW